MKLIAPLAFTAVLTALSAACAGVIGIDPPSGAQPATAPEASASPPNDAATKPEAAGERSCHADLASDPSHCGACGHDCAGGDCKAGRCQPLAVVLSSRTERFTVRAGSIFWYESSTIYRCGAPDCQGGPRYFTSTNTDLDQLLLGDDGLYFTRADSESSSFVYATGREVAAVTQTTVPAMIFGSTIGKGPAYFAGTSQMRGQTLVLRCSAGRCETSTGTLLTGILHAIVSTESDALVVLRPDTSSVSGIVVRCGPSGCNPQPLVKIENLSGSFAADTKTLAWTTSVDGVEALRACDLPACASPRTLGLAPSFAMPKLAADAEHIYVYDPQTSTLRRCALDRCDDGGELMAEDVAIEGLVSDGRFLYWLDYVRHAIQRLAK